MLDNKQGYLLHIPTYKTLFSLKPGLKSKENGKQKGFSDRLKVNFFRQESSAGPIWMVRCPELWSEGQTLKAALQTFPFEKALPHLAEFVEIYEANGERSFKTWPANQRTNVFFAAASTSRAGPATTSRG